MSIGPRLDLRQSQSLVMTPQLQQAIRLLALSNLEVESFIAEELERNPLLDSGSGESESERDAPADDEVRLADGSEGEAPDLPDALAGGAGEAPLDLDVNDENIHQDSVADRFEGGMDGGLGMEGIASGSS